MGKRIPLSVTLGALLLSAFFFPFTANTASASAHVSNLFEGGRLVDQLFDGSRTVGSKLENPVKFKSLGQLVAAIIDIIVQITVPIAALFLIYSGYLFVSARGSDDDLKTAKSIFLWTLVGIAVLLGAKVLAGIIEGTIAQIKR